LSKPKQLPYRVMLSLDEKTHTTLKKLAGAENKGVATFVRELVMQSLPQLETMAQVIDLVKKGDFEGAARLSQKAAQEAENARRASMSAQLNFLDDLERAKGAQND